MVQTQGCGKSNRYQKGNIVSITISRWLKHIHGHVSSAVNVELLYQSFPKSYTVYEPMLLLPHNAFKSPAWQELMSYLSPEHFQTLYSDLVSNSRLTHVAINAPIPLQSINPRSSSSEYNVLRLPSSIQPLHGNFGPPPSSTASPPTLMDFESAFWVSVRQNDIIQIWAPLHTMFSRGNISEKSRLLSLPSVAESVQRGREKGNGCAAVDLYGGIGYFAFSYVKAGVRLCLCWEINGWSVEGLRRGAVANKWSTQVVIPEGKQAKMGDEANEYDIKCDDSRLLVFQESNEFATRRIQKLREQLPPIRHVNCGLLPCSKPSWQTALEVMDIFEGGWLHLHQNIAVKEIVETAQDTLEKIQTIAADMWNDGGTPRVLELQNVEQVKTYAPGVMHCVLDIFIPPAPS